LPDDVQTVFISSVTVKGLDELKDVLWEELNSESNKLQSITAEDTLVHRDKEMSRFAKEMEDEGEDIFILDDEDMDDVEFVDEIEDFEYEDE
jgi:GTP-binding protein